MKNYSLILIVVLFSIHTYSQEIDSVYFELLDGYPTSSGFDPLCLDYDKDGNNEIVYTTRSSSIRMLNFDTELEERWESELPNYPDIISVGDITGDGFNEIAIYSYNKLYAINHLGKVLDGFPIVSKEDYRNRLVLEDMNGDGAHDIIVNSDGFLYVYDMHGKLVNGWPQYFPSKYATADMDNDGIAEIIGANSDQIRVWHSNGEVMKGWESVYHPQQYDRGDILVGDINNDGSNEVILKAKGLLIYDANGNILDGFPVYTDMWDYEYGWGALGDLNNDGFLEIVMICDKYLYAFDHKGNILSANFPFEVSYGNYRSPSIADVTGDGVPEILYGDGDGFLYILSAQGLLLKGFPKKISSSRISQLQLGDFNLDGNLDLIFSCGSIYAYTFGIPVKENTIQWSVWGHDSRRTSNYSNYNAHFAVPNYIELSQNFPNPFNNTTKIKYSLKNDYHVKLKVFDILGKEVLVLIDKFLPKGTYLELFSPNKLSSGIYFYRIQAGEFVDTKKMVLLK